MVDSIRRAERIGVITPSGQRRSVERRHHPHKEHHHQGGDDPSASPEEQPPAHTDIQKGTEPRVDTPTSSNEESPSPTGRCINVRI